MNAIEFAAEAAVRAEESAVESGTVAPREGKILVAVSDDLKRATLSRHLHRRGYGCIVAQGPQGVLAQLRHGGIDLVVCDAQDATGPDAGLIALVHQTAPCVPVMVLSVRDADAEQNIIDCAMGLSRALGRAPEGRNALACLTAREREVLERIVAGRANKMIAYELSISPRTVENHRARVMEKLRAKTVADLVRIALTAGCAAPSSPSNFDSANAGGLRATAAR